MKKLVFIIILLLLASQLILPSYFSNALETSFEEYYEFESLEIEVSSFPALLMLGGNFQRMNIEAEQLKVMGLEIALLEAEFSNLKLDLAQLNNELNSIEAENESLKILLTQEQLEDYLAHKLDEINDLKLILGPPAEALLRGNVRFLGGQLELKVAGDFELATENSLVFHPGDIMLGEMMISEEVVRQLLGGLDFSLDLEELALPLSLQMEELRVEANQLLILGGNRLE